MIRPLLIPGMSECTRDAYLDEQQRERAMMKEMRDCMMRRTKPGYAKLMDIRIGNTGNRPGGKRNVR